MKKTKAFYMVAIIAVSVLLLTTVHAQTHPEESRQHMARGQAAVEMAQPADKLEDKAEQVLTVAEIIDVLVSDFNYSEEWSYSPILMMGNRECRRIYEELSLQSDGPDTVKALQAEQNYDQFVRQSFQVLKVAGPVLKYTTTINVCGPSANKESGACDSVIENEIEVVTKKLIKVDQYVVREGVGAGVAAGDRYSCTFKKTGGAEISAKKPDIADVNAKDELGYTPLYWAVSSKNKEKVAQLIAKGADLNAKDVFGNTPLYWAVSSDNKEIVELLITNGADTNARDAFGESPLLQLAINRNNQEMIELLKKHGVHKNAKETNVKAPGGFEEALQQALEALAPD